MVLIIYSSLKREKARDRLRGFTTEALESRAEKRNKALINITGLSSGPGL